MTRKVTLTQADAADSPQGMAAAEYLLATTALTSAWLMLDNSPVGLGRALIDVLSAYSFSLSLPW